MFTCFFFFNDTATTEIYTLSLHDALPILYDVFCYRERREEMLQLIYSEIHQMRKVSLRDLMRRRLRQQLLRQRSQRCRRKSAVMTSYWMTIRNRGVNMCVCDCVCIALHAENVLKFVPILAVAPTCRVCRQVVFKVDNIALF